MPFKAENIAWVGEPSDPGTKLRDGSIQYRPYTLWPYRIRNSDVTYWMNETDFELYLAEKKILKMLAAKHINTAELIEAIKGYADIKYKQGQDDEAEQRADES